MEEIYKVIQGHKNYSVSNLGNVKNHKTEKILLLYNISQGYKGVSLKGKTYKVHRLVAKAFIPNPENKEFIDHIDCIRTNNNVNNLRYVTRFENSYNTSISKSNKSGHKGVHWDKEKNKWKAQISHNNKQYNLGRFDKLEDAIHARQKKANELFGEFTHSSERIVNLNIEIPKNTKLNINIKVKEEEEELRLLEEEFLEATK
jgi:hypothetical protein